MSIASNINNVRTQIPNNVTLICVSKFHPSEAILEAYYNGERCFGENRPQEMSIKADELPKDIQ